jgi:predicted nucleic acid-binding protein
VEVIERLLPDTNAYSALAAGHEGVRAQIARAREITLSAVVVGELL